VTELALFPTYCIDTSALIDLKELYPRDIFPPIWRNIETLIAQGRLVAPKEVYQELQRVEDELFKWAKEHKMMFKNLDDEQIRHVLDITGKFPKLVDEKKPGPQADPFVIALALSRGYIVITSESWGDPNKPKIPDVCNHYGIKCLDLVALYRKEKWQFDH